MGFPLRSRWRVLRTQFARGRGGTRRRFAAKGFRARLARQARARLFFGAAPLAPTFSKGESPPIMRAAEPRMGESRKSKQKAESQAKACASFANANAAKPKVKQNGNATANLARKLQPRKRRGVPPFPRANCGRRPRQRDRRRGNPKGGAALFGQSLPTFCWPESRGPARPERVEGTN